MMDGGDEEAAVRGEEPAPVSDTERRRRLLQEAKQRSQNRLASATPAPPPEPPVADEGADSTFEEVGRLCSCVARLRRASCRAQWYGQSARDAMATFLLPRYVRHLAQEETACDSAVPDSRR
jgi:hypothetical protein